MKSNYLKCFNGCFGIHFGWIRVQISLVQVHTYVMPFVVHHKVNTGRELNYCLQQRVNQLEVKVRGLRELVGAAQL